MQETKFSNIFIVVEEKEDAYYILKNIELIQSKVRIVLVNQWDDDLIGKEHENLTIVHSDSLMAAHLYDQLPNVPLVAQNVGLGQGEIMEVHVPFGSTYAYRHIGSILQRKRKIAALYRDDKQILPSPATMIRPNDTLLILGKPLVLDGVYRTINKRIGLFPEPFGKDIYLILDLRYDQEKAIQYVKESIFLAEKLEDKALFVRIIYPNNFALLDTLKAFDAEHVSISICYKNEDIPSSIEYDIHEHNIGLVMNSIATFEADSLKDNLYNLKKLIYLFGTKGLCDIKKAIVLMSENEKMESISSTAFDISETLGLDFSLCDFDPEGDFSSKKMIIENYETLAHIFNMEMHLEQKVANPIRELSNMENILQVAPFEKNINTASLRKLLSTKVENF
ncbi:MAG: hypothetical protein DRQ78_12775, partial [Epsilonproteobacteria bacterium]